MKKLLKVFETSFIVDYIKPFFFSISIFTKMSHILPPPFPTFTGSQDSQASANYLMTFE